jgi:hypothetical protein
MFARRKILEPILRPNHHKSCTKLVNLKVRHATSRSVPSRQLTGSHYAGVQDFSRHGKTPHDGGDGQRQATASAPGESS